MSKVDAMRKMREERFARQQAEAKARAAGRTAAVTKAPVRVAARRSAVAAAPVSGASVSPAPLASVEQVPAPQVEAPVTAAQAPAPVELAADAPVETQVEAPVAEIVETVPVVEPELVIAAPDQPPVEGLAVAPEPVVKARRGGRIPTGEKPLKPLMDAGFIAAGDVLVGRYKGAEFTATVQEDGSVEVPGFGRFDNLSRAGLAAMQSDRKSLNGWDFWRTSGEKGNRLLAAVRAELGT